MSGCINAINETTDGYKPLIIETHMKMKNIVSVTYDNFVQRSKTLFSINFQLYRNPGAALVEPNESDSLAGAMDGGSHGGTANQASRG